MEKTTLGNLHLENEHVKTKRVYDIATPSTKEVKHALSLWGTSNKNVQQEDSLQKLFLETYPKNIDLNDIIVKVCTLEILYSVRTRHTFAVAQHILNINLDEALDSGDIGIVNKLARIEVSSGKFINFHSFASKYCSHHQPETYSIYDSYVEKVLVWFRDQDNFYQFRTADLKDYAIFSETIRAFRAFYKLDSCSIKEIDRYLWQVGHKYFQTNI